MKPFHGLICLLAVAAIVLVAMAGNGFFTNDQVLKSVDLEKETPVKTKVQEVKHRSLSDALGVSNKDMVEVGGVKRPKRDVAFKPNGESSSEPRKNLLPSAGYAPTLQGNENPQVRGLVEELADDDTSRLARTTFFKPRDFHRETYEKDPNAYLAKIRLGRVFEAAQPGPNVEPIKSETPMMKRVIQGESVNLQVKVESGMPVTFYTSAVGEFDNRLTTQTVRADKESIAKVTYKAGPGTLGLIDILAASPVHSGQLNFKVKVSLPENGAENAGDAGNQQ